MNHDEIVNYAADYSEEIFEKCGEDITKCPREAAVVHLVIMAQGIIDNGGLDYIFENNWPGFTYDQFIDAFKEIGCMESAEKIRMAMASFKLDDVDNDVVGRRDYMMKNKGDDGRIIGWGKNIYGDSGVYENLAKYAIRNKKFFEKMEWK